MQMAHNDDLKNELLAGALIVFTIYAFVEVIAAFAGALTGRSSPLTPFAFLVLLLGFTIGSWLVVSIGGVPVFVGTAHTNTMQGNT
jgi:hypothetical protein